MNNRLIKSLLICFFLINSSFIKGQSLVTGDYSNMEGMQVYYIYSSGVYLFATYKGSSTSITSTIYLFLSDTKSKIDSSNGIWAGVGFGSSDMSRSDMVMCYYIPTNKFSCVDTWSDSEDNPPTDVSLGGKNDVSSVSGTIQSVSVSSYNSLITFTFTKDISNLDKYDWSNFSSWQTNRGGTSGAYGYLSDSKVALEHPQFSKRSSMSDGNGFRTSITVNLGGPSSTTTPTTTTPTTSSTNVSTTTATTTNPTTTPTTPTPSYNGAGELLQSKNLVVAIISLMLILFI